MDMFRKILWLMALALLPMSSPAFAEGDTTGEIEGAQEEEEVRPGMSLLFFSVEQRRVLEALRQNVVGEDEINVEDVFVPVILSQGVQQDEVTFENPEREENLMINSFIKSRSSGRTVLWVNSEIYDTESDKVFLERNGIVVDESAGAKPGSIVGVDRYNEVKFEIKPGQVIDTSGQIGETLPIVRKRK